MIPENQAPTTPETNHAPSPALANFEPYTPKPRYECTKNGVYFIGVKTDKDGNTSEAPPLLLSDPIHLIGRGIDTSGHHYRIIEYRDRITRQTKQAAITAADIGTNQGWYRLQSYGLTVLSGRAKRERLADYLQTDGQDTRYTVSTQSGWHESAYILPSGEVIQPDHTPKGQTRTIYNGDKSQAAAYTPSGTLAEWNEAIGSRLVGNSRLCLAVGTALAAPLAAMLNLEAGGFHLFGDSRDGKTTASRIALSVWGNPAALLQTWTGTSHGFGNLANARNDNLLVLDEIGQANPRQVAHTAYSVINGISKVQGAKDGGNREANRWKVLLFSTGEKPLENFVERGGEKWQAGQAARLPSVPSNAGKGLGIYDTLHGFESGALLSEHLNQSAAALHGTLGRAFIGLLQNQPAAAQTARQLQNDFMQTLPALSGQARTVALRMAAVSAALELAARNSLIPLPAGAGMAAIKQCFEDWHNRSGGGKYEDRAIIAQAAAFMDINALSMRFSDWHSQTVNRDHAGFRKQESNDTEYWIIPAVFESEICQDFDKLKVCEVLAAIAWLRKPENARGWQHQRKRRNGLSRFYVLINEAPPETEA